MIELRNCGLTVAFVSPPARYDNDYARTFGVKEPSDHLCLHLCDIYYLHRYLLTVIELCFDHILEPQYPSLLPPSIGV